MKAKEILDKYINKEQREQVGVIAISDNLGYWFHVHEDEEVPEDNNEDTFVIAMVPFSTSGGKTNEI